MSTSNYQTLYEESIARFNELYSERLNRVVEYSQEEDLINNPKHYTEHPSGVECIQITEHMNFCLGNAIKYIWRSGLKGDSAIEDLKKAVFYINREIYNLEISKE